MKPAKSAYFLLALGILLLTLSPILGASLSAKLAEIYGQYQTNKITATWLDNSNRPGQGSFSLEDMRQLAQYHLKDYDLAYAREAATSAAYEKNQSQVQVLGVNDRYHQFHQINLKAGSFITSGQENQQVAVIDEDLAQTLFQSCHVVGLEIELYGRKFKIIGVTEDDPSLMGTLTDKESGTVYIPVKKLLELEENSAITFLEVETRDSGTTGKNAADLKTALASIGQDPANYRIIDYNLEHLLLEQKNLVRNFIIGIGVLVLLFSLLKQTIQGIYGFFHLRLQEKYFWEVIKEDYTRLILDTTKILGLLGVMLLIGRLIKFPLYIAPESIPHELIDLSFWADLLKGGIQARVQSTGYIAPPGENQLYLLHNIQNWNVFFSLFLGLPLFFLGLYQVKVWGENLFKVEVFCGACLMVAFIIGTVLLLMTKMPLAVEARGVCLLFIAIFLAVIKEVRGHTC
ncbi:MAG: ABC transporter permease [Dehalobacterium sp.]